MKQRFDKMHGLGNDFVIIDAREQPFKATPAIARAIADRRTGIGCDQLIVLDRSECAELRMRIWNNDGSEVESCGNATRCVAKLTGARKIETAGGLLRADTLDEEIEVSIREPRFEWNEIPLAYPTDTNPLPMAWGELARPMALNVGNPHLVFFVEDVNAVPLHDLGPKIENDPLFPKRINVNVASASSTGLILRTWERGSGLTLACGTGACATGVAAIRSKRAVSPVTISMPGGILTIAWKPGEEIRMRGSATHVFSGIVDLEALE